MRKDVDISEINVIAAYATKLKDFQTWNMGRCILIDRQIRKIKEDLDNKKQTAQDLLRVGEERSNNVERRYDLALRMCNDGCRSKIGNSDTEIRQKLEILQMRYEQIQRSVEQLQLVLDNAGQRTKTYGLNMTNLADGSTQYLAELVAALEKLKEVKK